LAPNPGIFQKAGKNSKIIFIMYHSLLHPESYFSLLQLRVLELSNIASFTFSKDKYLQQYNPDTKSIEIKNKNPNEKILNTESKGTITIEGIYGTLKFERRLSHPIEKVWKAITDQKEIFRWLPDYSGTFDGYKGGAIDIVNSLSGSHVTGDSGQRSSPRF
jgi:hypothetical protein